MFYKNPTPIARLIKDVLNTTPYHDRWLKGEIMQACKIALPFVEGKIKRFYVKRDILYLKLNSTLLSHELRLNKTKVLARIQDACKTLGKNIKLQNVVFL